MIQIQLYPINMIIRELNIIFDDKISESSM